MKHLLESWSEVEAVLAPNLLLLADYDGTLTPIVGRPQDATISEDMRQLLDRLSGVYPIGIISGRALADIKEMVGVSGIYYAGNHGFEIEGPGVEFTKPEAERARPAIADVSSKLKHQLRHIEGAIIEDKDLTASVHYRLVADDRVQELKEIFNEVAEPHVREGKIRITRGKKVLELRPNLDWDKGKAVRWLIEVVSRERGRVFPVYMGDDLTDEDAFKTLWGEGLPILVSEGEKESNAKYFLRSVEEVKEFLQKLIPPRKSEQTRKRRNTIKGAW